MDEKDKQILELYLKDLKKKRLFFFLIIIILVVCMLFYGFYAKSKVSLNEVDNNTKELLLNDIERLLDNREIIHMYKCRKYYMAGINDILSIIFNNVN